MKHNMYVGVCVADPNRSIEDAGASKKAKPVVGTKRKAVSDEVAAADEQQEESQENVCWWSSCSPNMV
jgi:DNA-binding cell septation regulator SpoVG